jgi:hypothetical protein
MTGKKGDAARPGVQQRSRRRSTNNDDKRMRWRKPARGKKGFWAFRLDCWIDWAACNVRDR